MTSGSINTTLRIRVQPKSSSNRITVDDNGRISVAVTAPPANDAANRAVCAELAKRVGLAKSKVSVRSGARSRDKVIRFEGLDKAEALRRLSE